MMFDQRICPFCQNVVQTVEVDGVAHGKCIGCGLIFADAIKGRKLEEGEWDYVNEGYRGNFIYVDDLGRTIHKDVGTYRSLDEAERAVTSRVKVGRQCYVEYRGRKVSEWVDGDRDDLKRKHIKVEFSHTPTVSGEKADSTSTVITTQDVPTYKAIEYYLVKRDITVTKYVVTDDDGMILEESEVTSSSGSSGKGGEQ